MKWITRERPKIDRIACPWLVTRFIDKEPQFLFVPAADVLRVADETGAVPFDVPDVELTHDGDLCSTVWSCMTRYTPGARAVSGKAMAGHRRKRGVGLRPAASIAAANEGSVSRGSRRLLALLSLIALFAGAVAGECGEVALKLLKRVELPGVEGRIDHMILDRATQRLFVAALGNNSVEVVDLEEEKIIASLGGFERPQGLALLPEKHELLISNTDNGYVDVYDTQTLQRQRRIELKSDNDIIRYDPGAHLAYVGCGEGGEGALCVVDTKTYAKVKEIALSGHPESFQIERGSTRIFVNVPTAREVQVVDRQQGRVVAVWPLEARKNFPMALDEAQGRLFVATRDPASLLVLDTKTGKPIASLVCAGDADDIFYDPETQILLVSGGEGFVDAFQQQSADRYQLMSRVATVKGARTSLYLSESKRLLVAAAKSPAAPAQILVYGVTSVTTSKQ